MKYFKTSGVVENDIKKIAGEMINMQTGTKYYNDGVLLTTPIHNYNVHNVGNTEYTISLTHGFIVLLVDDTKTNLQKFLKTLEVHANGLYHDVLKLHSIREKSVIATQYICFESSAPKLIKIISHIGLTSRSNNYSKLHKINASNSEYFVWHIFDKNEHSHVYIPHQNNASNENVYTSINTIIYDSINLLTLNDNYDSIEYPLLTDYTAMQQNRILTTPILLSFNYGILLNIALHYIDICSHVETPRIRGDGIPIYFMRWDDAAPRKKSQETSIHAQIQTCNTLEYYNNTNSEKLPDYRCFFTNTPIYDDCYIIDIYEQTIEENNTSNNKQSNTISTTLSTTSSTTQLNKTKKTKKQAKTQSAKQTHSNQIAHSETKEITLNQTALPIHYDKPIHLLISHVIDHVYGSVAQYMKTYYPHVKFLLYRTKCPMRCEQIIDQMPVYKNSIKSSTRQKNTTIGADEMDTTELCDSDKKHYKNILKGLYYLSYNKKDSMDPIIGYNSSKKPYCLSYTENKYILVNGNLSYKHLIYQNLNEILCEVKRIYHTYS